MATSEQQAPARKTFDEAIAPARKTLGVRMKRFDYSIGDGNQGVSRMYPDGWAEADEINAALDHAIAPYTAQYGEPDGIDGDAESGYAVFWDEIDGAPALNGGAALIIEVWAHED